MRLPPVVPAGEGPLATGGWPAHDTQFRSGTTPQRAQVPRDDRGLGHVGTLGPQRRSRHGSGAIRGLWAPAAARGHGTMVPAAAPFPRPFRYRFEADSITLLA